MTSVRSGFYVGLAAFPLSAVSANVIGADSRLLLSDYAQNHNKTTSQVSEMFAATGVLKCVRKGRPNFSTAQVSRYRNVLTASRHSLFHRNCELDETKAHSCTFNLPSDGGNWKEYRIDMSSITVGTCKDRVANDWAVLRLDKPVEVKPYELPGAAVPLLRGSSLLMVSAYSANLKRGDKYPVYISECRVRDTERFAVYPLQTDCDTGSGASGSAQFVRERGQLVIRALHSGHTSDSEGLPYDSESNFGTSVPIGEELLEAVNRLGQ